MQGGAFCLAKVLGQGGFGITYEATELRLMRRVAIKEFYPVAQGCSRQGTTVLPSGSISASEFQEERKKFLEEAQRLAQFQHPSIVKVHTMFEENNTAYMVMEFLKGKTLAEIIRDKGTLPATEALTYVAQVGDALTVVHQANLLHRDIKPENVLISDDKRAVLIDFGTAREFAAGRTSRMTTMLTPGYAPLEQYGQRARFGVYSDIYSLGATLYHLITGEVPVQATDRAAGVELLPPQKLQHRISHRVSDCVLWAMEMRVDKRPQSIHEFLTALRGANRIDWPDIQVTVEPPQSNVTLRDSPTRPPPTSIARLIVGLFTSLVWFLVLVARLVTLLARFAASAAIRTARLVWRWTSLGASELAKRSGPARRAAAASASRLGERAYTTTEVVLVWILSVKDDFQGVEGREVNPAALVAKLLIIAAVAAISIILWVHLMMLAVERGT